LTPVINLPARKLSGKKEMIAMSMKGEIRRLHYRGGLSIKEICRRTGWRGTQFDNTQSGRRG